MILKFDHIALTCKRKELDEVLTVFSEYKQLFFEKGLPNLFVKKQFLSTWKEDHDIVLLNSETLTYEDGRVYVNYGLGYKSIVYSRSWKGKEFTCVWLT